MTKTEEARFTYLKGVTEYSDEKLEFLVRTGLTFDPKAKRMFNGEEKEYKDIDWYYPKGAAFKISEETPSDEPGTTQQNIDNTINDPNNNVTVNQDNGEGGTSSEQLDPTSTVEPITVDDGDDDDTNDETLATSNGEIIIGNDEP